MVIANSNQHIAPYWNLSTNLKLGLNQLGIRNVAEQMFAKLLPGLNNVSGRIRYYSFYCWLIQHFFEGKESVNAEDFNPYLRRAELLLAFINGTKDDSLGIPGIYYVQQQFLKNPERVSLSEGARDGSGSYWANPGGIFRQYYGASLEEIGLIGVHVSSNKVYNIRKDKGYINGEVLAESFSASVGTDGEVFLNLLAKDEITIDELRSLNQSFSMKLLPDDSQERKRLQDLLLQKDAPTHDVSDMHRHNTIKYVLEYLSIAKVPLSAAGFSKHMYESCRQGAKDMTAWGWYAYYLDDNWQYQLTRLFGAVLTIIKSSASMWTPIESVSDQITSMILDDLGVKDSALLDETIALVSNRKMGNDVSDAFNNLLWFYKENVDMMEMSVRHYHEMGIELENFCDFMKKIADNLQTPVGDFTRRIVVEDVIYRHYEVSFRKMLQTGLATQKFSVENGCLRFIDDWETSHTSPRIDTLRSFLIDLRLIDKDGKPCKKVLDSLCLE